MKKFVNKEITESIPFMGEEVDVRQLSISSVYKIQELVKKSNKSKSESAQINLMKDVLRMAVVGAEDMTNEDFDSLPLGELTKLSTRVLSISGLGDTTEAAAVGNSPQKS
jgi:hypothetical protein